MVAGHCCGADAQAGSLREYVGRFNREDEELYSNIPNVQALAFLEKNIPTLECPDEDIERTYYFRWWTYRKHIKETPEGYVVTEFLPKVSWAGKHNTICCPAGHHFREGRWLHDGKILDDYARFYLGGGGSPRQYSFWAADSILSFGHVRGDYTLAIQLLDELVKNFQQWEDVHLVSDGLFWQIDDRDGMEVSIGKSGKRPTINSYMYGDARAIAAIAKMAGKREIDEEYTARAERLRSLVNEKLWSATDQFYKTLPRSQYELVTPRDSSDKSVTCFQWFDNERKGTKEWFQYNFETPRSFNAAAVYWFINDKLHPLPAEWRVLYLDDKEWKPVVARESYPTEKDQFCRVDFEPVTTVALRLEVQARTRVAAGIHEWQVFSGAENIASAAKISTSVQRRTNPRGNTVETLNDGAGPAKEAGLVGVRELHGFTPWYFHLPEPGRGREIAWRQLMDAKGFHAPYGPTTAEQRHPQFVISYEGHECQWNGPSWPYATSVTLTAMANVLNDYPQNTISRKDYLEMLRIYARSHIRKLEDGSVVCWIDENLNPYTGDWIARTRLKSAKGVKERGKDYNHSTFCDLIISGLMGLRPRADDVLEINPLIPEGTWDWCRMDNILYHGRLLSIQWDRDGTKFNNGTGLRIFADGKLIAQEQNLKRIEVPLGATLPPK